MERIVILYLNYKESFILKPISRALFLIFTFYSMALLSVDFTFYLADRDLNYTESMATDKVGNRFEIFPKNALSIMEYKKTLLSHAIGGNLLPLYPAYNSEGERVFLRPFGKNSLAEDRFYNALIMNKRIDSQILLPLEMRYLTRVQKGLEQLTSAQMELMHLDSADFSESLHSIQLFMKNNKKVALKVKFAKPWVLLPSIQDREKPIDQLWNIFWNESTHATSGEIAQLRIEASTSEKIYFTSNPHLTEEVYLQRHLNPKNRKTLVVVPLNDREAETIYKIAQKIGMPTLPINEAKGLKLEHLSDLIVSKAREVNAEKIIVCEIPPEVSSGLEESIGKRASAEYIIVDHHNYSFINRYNPLSSLEQFSNIVGYDLSSAEKKVAVSDRSFLYGLMELGLSLDELIYDSPSLLTAPSKIKNSSKINTSWGTIHLVKNQNMSIGMFGAAFAVEDYPKVPNIFIINGDNIKFVGNPSKVRELVSTFEKYAKDVDAIYSGGDQYRSMYFGIKGFKGISKEKILEEMNQVLKIDEPSCLGSMNTFMRAS